MNKNFYLWIPQAIASIMLLRAISYDNTHEHYDLLRWVVCVCFASSSRLAFKYGSKLFGLILIVIAIIFNPIIPFHFPRQVWKTLDMFGFCMGLCSILELELDWKKNRHKTKKGVRLWNTARSFWRRFNTIRNAKSLSLKTELIDDDLVSITGYTGNESHVDIPSTIGKRPVVQIGAWAFKNCDVLVEVTIPEGVTEISGCAFMNCVNLTKIKLPKSLTEIGNDAFASSGLSCIFLPDQIKRIGPRAFHCCERLTLVQLPEYVRYIGDSAFARCKSLETVSVPSNATEIGSNVFYECSALTRAEIFAPALGQYMFSKCNNLWDISLGRSLHVIKERAFAGCTSVENIFIYDNVFEIHDYAFCDCVNLKRVYFMGGIPRIESSVFSGVNNATIFFSPEKCFAGRPFSMMEKFELLDLYGQSPKFTNPLQIPREECEEKPEIPDPWQIRLAACPEPPNSITFSG